MPITAKIKINGESDGESEVTFETITGLIERLRKKPDVTHLDLSNQGLGREGVTALAKALEENNTVKHLDLRHNNIGPIGATAIAKALYENKAVTTLKLMGNDIGSDGAIALAKAITVNNTLESLQLMNNEIGSDGATALAKAMEMNDAVTLNLYRNNLNLTAISGALEMRKRAAELANRLSELTIGEILTTEDVAFLSDRDHPENSFKVLDNLFRGLGKLKLEEKVTPKQVKDFYRDSHDFNFVAKIAVANAGHEKLKTFPARPSITFGSGKEQGRLFSVGEKTLVDRVLERLSPDIKSERYHGETLEESRMAWERKMRERVGASAGAAGAGGGGGEGRGDGGGGGGGAGAEYAGDARPGVKEKKDPSADVASADAECMGSPPKKRFRDGGEESDGSGRGGGGSSRG